MSDPARANTSNPAGVTVDFMRVVSRRPALRQERNKVLLGVAMLALFIAIGLTEILRATTSGAMMVLCAILALVFAGLVLRSYRLLSQTRRHYQW